MKKGTTKKWMGFVPFKLTTSTVIQKRKKLKKKWKHLSIYRIPGRDQCNCIICHTRCSKKSMLGPCGSVQFGIICRRDIIILVILKLCLFWKMQVAGKCRKMCENVGMGKRKMKKKLIKFKIQLKMYLN